MKVYIVFYSYYDDWEIEGVFSTEEKAKNYIKSLEKHDHWYKDYLNYFEMDVN